MLNLRLFFSFFLIARLLTSCSEDDVGKHKGELQIQLNVNETRFGVRNNVSSDPSAFTIEIYATNSSERVFSQPYGEISNPIELNMGTYYVTAHNHMDFDSLFQNPYYFVKSNHFDIKGDEPVILGLNAELTTARFRFYLGYDITVFYKVKVNFYDRGINRVFLLSQNHVGVESYITSPLYDKDHKFDIILEPDSQGSYSLISVPLGHVLANKRYTLNINGFQTPQSQLILDLNTEVEDWIADRLTVQERLDVGEKPISIFNSSLPLDSIYGRFYQGGVISHLDTINGSGLIIQHWPDVNQFSDKGVDFRPNSFVDSYGIETSENYGSGYSNTTNIIEKYGTTHGYAALSCALYTSEGFDDWYLPSKGELEVIYTNLLNSKYSLQVGFPETTYWTSTIENGRALGLIVDKGTFAYETKFDKFWPTAVRTFQ